jgi:hypothetical protein
LIPKVTISALLPGRTPSRDGVPGEKSPVVNESRWDTLAQGTYVHSWPGSHTVIIKMPHGSELYDFTITEKTEDVTNEDILHFQSISHV